MDNQRLLSALCYFSIFFAPFLLPIIVYFISKDNTVKYHAKRSIISHLIPIVIGVVGLIIWGVLAATLFDQVLTSGEIIAMSVPFLLMGLYTILSLVIMIWNVIQGIRVLQA